MPQSDILPLSNSVSRGPLPSTAERPQVTGSSIQQHPAHAANLADDHGCRHQAPARAVGEAGRIVSVAVIVSVGVNAADSRREVLALDIGPSKAETFWTAFLRKLARRGLRGVKPVISDTHEASRRRFQDAHRT